MVTGYGKVTYFNRKIPPSRFLKNLLKNVELNVENFSTKATGLKIETLKEDDLKVIGLDSVSRVSEYIEDLNNLEKMSKEKRKQMISDLDRKKTKVVGKKKIRALVESQMGEVKKYKSIVQQSSFEKKVVFDAFKDEHKKFNFIIDEFPLMLGSLPKDVKEKLKTADPKSSSEIKKNIKRSYIDVLTESDTVISDFGPYTSGEKVTGRKMFESSIDCCKKLIRMKNQNQRREIKKSIINEKKKVINEEVKKLTEEIAENLRNVSSYEDKTYFKSKKEICPKLVKQCEEWEKERKGMKEERTFLRNRFKILEKLEGPEEFEKIKDLGASCYLNTIIIIRNREKKEDKLNKLVKCNYLTPVGGPFNLYKKNGCIEGDKSIVKDNSFTRSLKRGQEISLRFKGKGNKNKTLKWKEKSGKKKNKRAERASIIEKTKTELLGKNMDKIVIKTFLKETREMRVRENTINRNKRVEQHKGNILPLGKMLREILKILKIKGIAPNNLMTLGGTDYRSCLEEIDEEVARISARYLKIKLVE